jgi:hypothetical protein
MASCLIKPRDDFTFALSVLLVHKINILYIDWPIFMKRGINGMSPTTPLLVHVKFITMDKNMWNY